MKLIIQIVLSFQRHLGYFMLKKQYVYILKSGLVPDFLMVKKENFIEECRLSYFVV